MAVRRTLYSAIFALIISCILYDQLTAAMGLAAICMAYNVAAHLIYLIEES